MRRFGSCVAALGMAGISSLASAGPFSSGLQNNNPGAPDAAVAGFVGPNGPGKSAAPNGVNPAFAGWATSCASYEPAPGVDPGWNDPATALGKVTGDNFDIVSLGDLDAEQLAAGASPGTITLAFRGGIGDAAGPDFVVFENAHGSAGFVFAELAYVEVSSDGEHFARFPAVSLTPAAVGAYGSIDPANVYNLAGKHVNAYGNSWGTPFDLGELADDPLLMGGQVNVHGIRYVRLIDIPGNGSSPDSSGRPIYDAWPTFGSGGFDLEAIGVTNEWLGGDASLDGVVDVIDLGIVATNWQQSPRDFAQGDFNQDGIVDVVDLGILASNWQTGPAAAEEAAAREGMPLTVPEPAGLGLVGGIALLCGWMGSRREKMKMKQVLIASLGLGLAGLGSMAEAVTVADFEDRGLAPGSYYNGSDQAGGFSSRGVLFSNEYNANYGSWSGFACSSVNDPATPGWSNQYAAAAGSGYGGGGAYGVCYDPGAYGGIPTVTLPSAAAVQGMFVTNTTYALLAIRDGNDGFGQVRAFGATSPGESNQGVPDWFKLTITGRDKAGAATGSVDFYLADYRFDSNADDYAVSDWRWMDLSGLGSVKTLQFKLDSSDVGTYGINTPTYFALDNLTVAPEPGGAAVGVAAGVLAAQRRRRRQGK